MRTVLVADDSNMTRKVARHILEGYGFAVAEAGDGRQAFAHVAEAMPDAVLLDWNMPVMDSVEFLRALRALPGGGRPKVIFCAIENDLGMLARALHAGADETLLKPFDRERLAGKLRSVGLV